MPIETRHVAHCCDCYACEGSLHDTPEQVTAAARQSGWRILTSEESEAIEKASGDRIECVEILCPKCAKARCETGDLAYATGGIVRRDKKDTA